MIKYAIYTDKGNRNINEDSANIFSENDRYCFVLCDGLGGHGMGDVASSLVVNNFQKLFSECHDFDFLEKAFVSSQEMLLQKQKEEKATNKMKTTCVALEIVGKKARAAYVGDSRLYVFNKNRLKQRTLDHSIPQMLVMSKEIKEKDIRFHPDRSLLMRVMGTEWDEPKYDMLEDIDINKSSFLLCSDGFWEFIDEKEMKKCLKNSVSPSDWLEKMLKIVRENGKNKNMDNYTAIAVWC